MITMRKFHHTVESFNFVGANLWGLWVLSLICGDVISWIHQLSVSVGKTNSFIVSFRRGCKFRGWGLSTDTTKIEPTRILMIPQYFNKHSNVAEKSSFLFVICIILATNWPENYLAFMTKKTWKAYDIWNSENE